MAGIAGGLGGEIIRVFVDDDRAVEDIFDLEALVVKGIPCVALIAKEGEQIPGMPGMGFGAGIIMAADCGKILGAVAVFVDVERIKAASFKGSNVREMEDLGFD